MFKFQLQPTTALLVTLVLIYLTTIQQVHCRIHRVKQRTQASENSNSNSDYAQSQSGATSGSSSSASTRYDLYQLQNPKSPAQPELPALNGVKPKFIFFPSSSSSSSASTTLSKKSDTALSAADYEGEPSSDSSSSSIMSSLKARFGAKFGKDAQNKVDGGAGGGGGGPPPDVFTRIGSVLGILGLGTLFIAELSSSFSAPFLIPILMVPLTFVVLLRLAWDNIMMGPGMVDVDMWM